MPRADLITVLVYVAIALGAVALAAAWRRVIRLRAEGRWLNVIPLLLATSSYVWLLAVLFWPAAVGPDYSAFRFRIIEANFVACAIAALGAAVFSRGARSLVALTSIWVGVLWFYLAVVSVAV